MQRHAMTKIVKFDWGGGGGRGGGRGGGGGGAGVYIDFTWPKPSPLVLPLYIQDICLFSPREGFLTHQCNISENINIKNEYRDETTIGTRQQKINEMLKQKKTNSWTPVGPTRARASGTNRLTLKSLGQSRHRV